VEPEKELRVAPEEEGRRLDLFLASHLGLSRRYVRRLLEREWVRLEGRPAVKGVALRAGDRVRVSPFRHPSEGIIPERDLEVPILLARDGLVFTDKPAGVPVHPLDFDETGTLANGMLARYPGMQGVGEGGLLYGVVHRLDVGTSGVLVFATEQEAWRRAREEFEARRAEKVYLARAHGRLRGEREVRLRLEHRGPRMRVVQKGGREAVTQVQALREEEGETLVRARPVTGLMHQIRITLSRLGHPVVGDRLYGSPVDLGRHLLHATRLRVGHLEAASTPPERIDA
jgi:23S rRNA pseudouridine1911/1915/1917 synthase